MNAATIRRTPSEVREMREAERAGREVTAHLSTAGMTTIRRGLRAALIAEGRTPWQADWQLRNT